MNLCDCCDQGVAKVALEQRSMSESKGTHKGRGGRASEPGRSLLLAVLWGPREERATGK